MNLSFMVSMDDPLPRSIAMAAETAGSDGAPLPPELLRNLSGMSGAPSLTRRLVASGKHYYTWWKTIGKP